jgi:hypothetical protein
VCPRSQGEKLRLNEKIHTVHTKGTLQSRIRALLDIQSKRKGTLQNRILSIAYHTKRR